MKNTASFLSLWAGTYIEADKRSNHAPSSQGNIKPKKRGAPNGHPYWSRAVPTHIDNTVKFSAPDQCPHCNCQKLKKIDQVKKLILLTDEKNQDHKAIGFCDDIKQLFKDACMLGRQIRSNQNETNKAAKYKHNLQQRLIKISKVSLSDSIQPTNPTS